ncbi:MAG: DNA-binding response regulator [Chloroflexota bacterium]|jgi:DNA-binding response OmpR family regulator|nr:response regulator transcription factor [Caldilinea sp.]GIK75965.1 MAG: DNA-binding response regulator [Chloroflexota bacterium]
MTNPSLLQSAVSPSNISVLVVDDEEPLRHLLQVSLQRQGYTVAVARNGREALDVVASRKIDLVLLDIMMPEMDGFTACAELRKRTDIPVVMLTALNRPDDIVHGFNLGADDYITKPFTFREVEVRLQAILRRVYWSQERPDPSILVGNEIVLDDERHEVVVRGEPVHLTPIEYQLLRFLMTQPNRPVSKDMLFQQVWGYDLVGGTNLVEVAVRRLREKIERDPSQPVYLLTVRGAGYKFNTERLHPS